MRDGPIAQLRPLVGGDHTREVTKLADEADPLVFGQGRGARDVEHQLDAVPVAIRVLSSGSSGRAEPELEFVRRDREPVVDLQISVDGPILAERPVPEVLPTMVGSWQRIHYRRPSVRRR